MECNCENGCKNGRCKPNTSCECKGTGEKKYEIFVGDIKVSEGTNDCFCTFCGCWFETERTMLDKLWVLLDEGGPRKTWSRSIAGGIGAEGFEALHRRDRELARGGWQLVIHVSEHLRLTGFSRTGCASAARRPSSKTTSQQ